MPIERKTPAPQIWSRTEAAHHLIGNAGLYQRRAADRASTRQLLTERRCIQLDPLDRIGTNADLVAMARLNGMHRGQIFDHLYPHGAFEHFAKERCFLPASAFPAYRDQALRTPEWRSTARQRKISADLRADVLAEITARGPLSGADLTDRGRIEPVNWHGWKSTSKAATMALEVLWLRCEVVTVARHGRKRIFDIPSRALPAVFDQPGPNDFFEWALLERVAAIGLMPRNDGPWWSMLGSVRKTLPNELLDAGKLVEVHIENERARYLALPDLRNRQYPKDDGQMRILGPLDPLLWSRPLIKTVFDFEYVWEVYKPAAKRQYGYYVCPLLHQGRLVGRFEGRATADGIERMGLWPQPGETFEHAAFEAALARHTEAMG